MFLTEQVEDDVLEHVIMIAREFKYRHKVRGLQCLAELGTPVSTTAVSDDDARRSASKAFRLEKEFTD